MANFSHYTRGSVASMTQHYERKKNENGEYLKFKNQQIDTSKCHLNYNLAEEKNQISFVKERTESLKCLKRKNVNVLASWLITVPQEVPKEYQREFFQKAYDYLEKKYKKENVVSAWVHNDENQPHLHFAFVPVVFDKKKGREKVSCKECVTQLDLQKFHGELQEYFDQWINDNNYGFDCPVLNGATEGGNKTIEQLKIERLQADNEGLEEEFVGLINSVGRLEFEHEHLSEELETLTGERKSLKTEISDLTDKASQIASNAVREQEKLSALQTEIKKRENSLKILDETLNKTTKKAIEQFGTWENVKAEIKAVKEEKAKELRLSLLERFIQLPQIKPLWESFMSHLELNKHKNKEKER